MCVEHTVRRVAERVGLPPRTVRYYDRIGLVSPPERSPAGYRLYSAEDEGKLRFVKQAKGFGFSLDQIRGLMAAAEEESCGGVSSELNSLLDGKIDEIAAQIDELRSSRDNLIAYRDERKSAGGCDGHGAFCRCLEGSPVLPSDKRPLARTRGQSTTAKMPPPPGEDP